MKKAVIEDNGLNIAKLQAPMYGSKKPYLGFVSKDNEGVCKLVTCKDYLHEIIRAAHEGTVKGGYNAHGYDPLKHPKLSFNELRFLFCHTGTKEELKVYAGKGLAILNKFEEYAGFKKSTMEFVSLKLNARQGLLLKGSSVYMRNPHLLALAVLVMRFSLMVDLDIDNVKTAFDAADVIYNKALKLCGSVPNLSNDDRGMIRTTARYMPYVLKRRSTLFKGITPEKLFRKDEMNNRTGFHSSGGILSLVTSSTQNSTLNSRMKKMREKLDFK